jgi:shikimate kinase
VSKNNIILIGFMGVGKGTTARAYSKEYSCFNIDTDDLIESKENMSIKEIFRKYGEERFRALERECANWIEKSVDNTFISCGGGFYKVGNIKKLGKIVLLNASYDWIYNRLITAKNAKTKLKKRPLFSKPDEARKLYNQREKEYFKIADIIINVEQRKLIDIIREIHTRVLDN